MKEVLLFIAIFVAGILLAKGMSTFTYPLLFEQQVVDTIKEEVKPECLVGEQK